MAALATLVVAAGLTSGARAPAQAAGEAVPHGWQLRARNHVDTGAMHWHIRLDHPAAQDVHVARIAPELAGRLRVMTAHDQVAGTQRTETTSSMCLRVRCLVAVNGDYTEHDGLGAVGPVVADGEVIRTSGIRMGLFSLDGQSRPSITHDPTFDLILAPAGTEAITIDRVNRPRVADSLVLYTPRFGPSTLTNDHGRELVLELQGGPWGRAAGGTPVHIAELRVPGNTPIQPNQVVLSGHGRGADAIQALWHQVTSSGERQATVTVDPGDVVEMLGGSPTLVRDAHRWFPDNPDTFTRGRHPRTVVGWTASGELLLVTVDGRQPGHSEGMPLSEAADLLIALGAVEALNLDGGGSTTFVVNSRVVNRPSDPGRVERPVTTALVLLPVPGTVATASVRSTDDACPPGGSSSDFTDVVESSPHRDAIDCVVRWALTTGTSPGRYSPGVRLDRGQMATFLARMIERTGGSLPAATDDRYPDISHTVHRDAINRLAAAGVIGGRSDGTYGPEAPVTRAQMASLLVRAHEHRGGLTLAPTADYFADDANDVHEPAINALAFAGITGGREHPHLYGPAGHVQREQMASFLARLLDLLVEEGTVERSAVP
ncbi:MAG TPA: phosphodiester glycosidase family protein [Acidimicrobiales bacterium]|nr:phosphodiester glycosidase family protein [Acidimicrobiales bacterium]